MKRFIIAVAILTVILACDEKPKNPVAEKTNNPVAQYGDTMVNSYQKGKQAGIDGNLDAVRKAVQAYHATNDKYPQNLDDIKPLLGGSDMDFANYDYNPENGTVNLKSN